VNRFYDNIRRVLNPLDFVATRSASSRLHRVDTNVNYSFQYEDDDDVEPHRDAILRVVHDGLPLLHMKSMLMVEADFGPFTDSEHHFALYYLFGPFFKIRRHCHYRQVEVLSTF
jgi:hypothetical protein